jgi:hypothetical protein
MMKKTIFLSSVALLASGCASDSWLYPMFNAEDQRALVNDGAKLTAVPLTVDDARNLVFGLTEKLNTASRHRDYAKMITHELLFYGSLLAVGGVAASSIALRNVGAGIAAGSVALDNHYQPSVQSLAFDRAAQRMRCARDLLDPIDPALLDALPADARQQIHPEIMSLYAAIPHLTNSYVEKVSLDLRAALTAVTLSAPSEQDLLNSLQNYTTAQGKSLQYTSDLHTKVSLSVKNTRVIDEKAAVSLAASAASSASATTPPQCVLPSAAKISPSSSREYRVCVIRGKSPEEQGELAQAFGQAVGIFSEQMDLCLKTHQQ